MDYSSFIIIELSSSGIFQSVEILDNIMISKDHHADIQVIYNNMPIVVSIFEDETYLDILDKIMESYG